MQLKFLLWLIFAYNELFFNMPEARIPKNFILKFVIQAVCIYEFIFDFPSKVPSINDVFISQIYEAHPATKTKLFRSLKINLEICIEMKEMDPSNQESAHTL